MNTTVLAGLGVAAAGAAVLCCAAPTAPAADVAAGTNAPPPAAAKPGTARIRKPARAPEPEPEPEPVPEMDVSNLPPVEFIAAPGADAASLSGTTLLMVRPTPACAAMQTALIPGRCVVLSQPVVSIGNAGQLAVDMLLASLVSGGVPRVGFLDCPHVLPIAGHDAFAGAPRKSKGTQKGKKGKAAVAAPNTRSLLSVNVEVFLDAPRGLTILQIRAPVAPGRHREHAAMLAAWIKSVGFSRVVSLSSLPIHARREAQLADPEVMRAVQTSAVPTDDSLVQPPLALRLESELQSDPAIWRPRSSTVLLHDEAERRGIAQTTILRFCEVMRSILFARDLTLRYH